MNSLEQFSARNLKSLNQLSLIIKEPINEIVSKRVFENLSAIEELKIEGVFSNLNLDDLVNLKNLNLSGSINNEFNFGLLKNLCNQLEKLEIYLDNIDNEKINQLFFGLRFPNLEELTIEKSKITKLEKKMFDGFPTLKTLHIRFNNDLRIIDFGAFSSLTSLVNFVFNNNSIETLEKGVFSELVKLDTLKLNNNQINDIEENVFSNLANLKDLDLSHNKMSIVKPQSFIGLNGLEKLNLNNNVLTDLDFGILEYICRIKNIGFDNNKILKKQETQIKNRLKDSKISSYYY